MVLAIVVLLVRGEISVKTNVLENVHRVAVDKQQENVRAVLTMLTLCIFAMRHAVRNGLIVKHVTMTGINVQRVSLDSGTHIVIKAVRLGARNVINPLVNVKNV